MNLKLTPAIEPDLTENAYIAYGQRLTYCRKYYSGQTPASHLPGDCQKAPAYFSISCRQLADYCKIGQGDPLRPSGPSGSFTVSPFFEDFQRVAFSFEYADGSGPAVLPNFFISVRLYVFKLVQTCVHFLSRSHLTHRRLFAQFFDIMKGSYIEGAHTNHTRHRL